MTTDAIFVGLRVGFEQGRAMAGQTTIPEIGHRIGGPRMGSWQLPHHSLPGSRANTGLRRVPETD